MASAADVLAAAEDHPGGNIAIRVPPTVAGIDCDAHRNPQAAADWAGLVAELGPLLEDAPWSTSRDDGVSGIRWLSIPAGTELAGVLPGDCGEVIQHHHRYIVAPPSIHPDTGKPYRWIGQPDGWIPKASDLPPLPQTWLRKLRGGSPVSPLFQQPGNSHKPGFTNPDVDALAIDGMKTGTSMTRCATS